MHWLGWIRFFEAAARHESFVRAAEELHLTHGAVSRQIRQLEDTLGVALFERRNRGVFLTEAGRTYERRRADCLRLYRCELEWIDGNGCAQAMCPETCGGYRSTGASVGGE